MRKTIILSALATILVVAFSVVVVPEPVGAATGTTVATTTSSLGGGMESFQRKNFYANGRYWVFYSDGTDCFAKSSLDGATWGTAQAVKTGITRATRFSVHFDGTYFHYAAALEAANQPLTYRMGTPNGNGTITWAAAEQTVLAANASLEYRKPVVITDVDGYPWIGCDNVESGVGIHAYVLESTTKDGTWTMDGDSPHTLFTDNGCKATSLIPIASERIDAFYVDVNMRLYYTSWNGSSWCSAETVANSTYALIVETLYSAILNNDVIDVAWISSVAPFTTSYLYFRERASNGTWAEPIEVTSIPGTTIQTSISLMDDVGDVVVFWGNATDEHIYYKSRVAETWDTSATDFLDESVGVIVSGGQLASTVVSNLIGDSYVIGLQYMTGSGSPYSVKFALLDVTLPVVSTSAASSVALTTARLNGVVDSDGGEDVTVRFGWGTTSQAIIEDYDSYETVAGTFTEGEHPYLDVTGLTSNTTYYFRIEGTNIYGGDLGSELSFTTETILSGNVTGFSGIPYATSIDLLWDALGGASQYMIRYKLTGYPTGTSDGSLVYFDSSTSTSHTFLTPGTTYYYSIWGESGGTYTAGYDTLMLTTSVAGGNGTITPPTEPTRWLAAPDYTNMASLVLIYDVVNDMADAVDTPRATAWFVIAILTSVLLGLLAYLASRGKLMLGVIVAVALLVFWWGAKQVPLWIPIVGIALIVAIFVGHREVSKA